MQKQHKKKKKDVFKIMTKKNSVKGDLRSGEN